MILMCAGNDCKATKKDKRESFQHFSDFVVIFRHIFNKFVGYYNYKDYSLINK